MQAVEMVGIVPQNLDVEPLRHIEGAILVAAARMVEDDRWRLRHPLALGIARARKARRFLTIGKRAW
jgi:hypothetical protein